MGMIKDDITNWESKQEKLPGNASSNSLEISKINSEVGRDELAKRHSTIHVTNVKADDLRKKF